MLKLTVFPFESSCPRLRMMLYSSLFTSSTDTFFPRTCERAHARTWDAVMFLGMFLHVPLTSPVCLSTAHDANCFSSQVTCPPGGLLHGATRAAKAKQHEVMTAKATI